MKTKRLIRIAALALTIIALIAVTACKRGGADDGARLDILVSESGYVLWETPEPPPLEEYVDVSDLVPKPERHMPFEAGEVSFVYDNAAIKMIEINQCLSYGFDTETGEFYLIENFVAGKETAVFVAFEEPFDMRGEAVLTIERDGQVVAQLSPVAAPDELTLLFQPNDMADVGYWAAGAYSFTFEMDGGKAVRTVNFYESKPVRVLAVPVTGNFGGRVVRCQGTDWWDGVTMLTAEYPVARADMEYIIGPELDLSADIYDLKDENWGMFNAWDALCRLQDTSNPYTLILGFISEPCGEDGNVLGFTCSGSNPKSIKASFVVESQRDWLAIIPHEVAHCYGIGDEYPNGSLAVETNMPPYGITGHVMGSRAPASGTNPLVLGGWDHGLDESGAWIYDEQRAYWVEGRTLLSGATSYMGWCTGRDPFTRWTTSEIWNHIYSCFIGHSAEPGAGDDLDVSYGPEHVPEYWGQCPCCFMDVYDPCFYVECWQCHEFVQMTGSDFDCSACGARWWLEDYEDDLYLECPECRYFIWYNSFEEHNSGREFEAQRAEQGLFTRITGYIEGGSFYADPWYTHASAQDILTPAWAGEFGAFVYDSNGELLSKAYFNVDPLMMQTTLQNVDFVARGRIPVDVNVRFSDEAASIVIKRGEEIFFTQNVSPNAPVADFTGLTAGQQLTNNETLTWDASDADGDELYFDVWYCTDGGARFKLASNVTGRSADVDLSELPGTDAGYFLIRCTDGVRTVEAKSPMIKVPFKAPVIKSEIEDVPEFKLTEEICFFARVYDYQDGWLWGEGNSVVWLLNGREYAHCGYLWVWPYGLAPGEHTFTCLATNSAGLTAQKDFTFRVIDDESDLPDGWTRDDVVNALSYGFVLPLDTLEAPVTRSQFAKIMANFFSYIATGVAGEGADNPLMQYDLTGLVTDCGLLAVEQSLMVAIGAMDAPGGLFEPARALTQQEALVIMYKVLAIGLNEPGLLADASNMGYMREFFEYNRTVEASGPNAYVEQERLTVELALVRVSKFFNWVDNPHMYD